MLSGKSGRAGVGSFAADSDLVSQIAYKSDASTTVASTVRGFEGTRDLITSVENKWDSTTVSKFEYTNDALGRRTSVTVSGSAFNTTGTTGFDLFTYNDRNELATAKRYTGGTLENPTNPVYTRHFGYDDDPIGNRESYQIGQGTATTYTANELNQYSATANPSESFTHDDDGNLTQDGTYTYVWDAENRLIEAYPTNPTTGSQKCVMTYDYMNRRVQRSLYNWTGSAWAGTYSSSRIFIYDGWNNLIAYNPAGGLSAFRKNTWGLDLSGLNGNAAPGGIHGAGGIGGLIGSSVVNSVPSQNYLCFYDANGNLSETIKNTDGTLWGHFEYDPWGKQLVKHEPTGMAHPFRYSTKYSDGVFEKYYYGQRYLDYRYGRWMRRDPILELGGENLYAFLFNNAGNSVDPIGNVPNCSSCSVKPTLVCKANDASAHFSILATVCPHCCCESIQFIQIVRERSATRADPLGFRIHPWHYDGVGWFQGSPFYTMEHRSGRLAGCMQGYMGDSPGLDEWYWVWYTYWFEQEFETCAVCVSSADRREGCIIGCVQWTHKWNRDPWRHSCTLSKVQGPSWNVYDTLENTNFGGWTFQYHCGH